MRRPAVAPRRLYAAPARDDSVFARRSRLRFNPPPTLVLAGLLAPSVGLFAYSAYASDRAQRGSVTEHLEHAERTRDSKPMKFLQDHFVLSLRNVREGRVYTMVTAGFMHFGASLHHWLPLQDSLTS